MAAVEEWAGRAAFMSSPRIRNLQISKVKPSMAPSVSPKRNAWSTSASFCVKSNLESLAQGLHLKRRYADLDTKSALRGSLAIGRRQQFTNADGQEELAAVINLSIAYLELLP